MPVVGGKKFPYTAKGRKAAAQAAQPAPPGEGFALQSGPQATPGTRRPRGRGARKAIASRQQGARKQQQQKQAANRQGQQNVYQSRMTGIAKQGEQRNLDKWKGYQSAHSGQKSRHQKTVDHWMGRKFAGGLYGSDILQMAGPKPEGRRGRGLTLISMVNNGQPMAFWLTGKQKRQLYMDAKEDDSPLKNIQQQRPPGKFKYNSLGRGPDSLQEIMGGVQKHQTGVDAYQSQIDQMPGNINNPQTGYGGNTRGLSGEEQLRRAHQARAAKVQPSKFGLRHQARKGPSAPVGRKAPGQGQGGLASRLRSAYRR